MDVSPEKVGTFGDASREPVPDARPSGFILWVSVCKSRERDSGVAAKLLGWRSARLDRATKSPLLVVGALVRSRALHLPRISVPLLWHSILLSKQVRHGDSPSHLGEVLVKRQDKVLVVEYSLSSSVSCTGDFRHVSQGDWGSSIRTRYSPCFGCIFCSPCLFHRA